MLWLSGGSLLHIKEDQSTVAVSLMDVALAFPKNMAQFWDFPALNSAAQEVEWFSMRKSAGGLLIESVKHVEDRL